MLRNGLSTPLPSQHDVITQVYDIFFELAPAGQEYFKQSATRAFVALGMIGMTGWLAIQKPGGSKVHGIQTGGFGIQTGGFGIQTGGFVHMSNEKKAATVVVP